MQKFKLRAGHFSSRNAESVCAGREERVLGDTFEAPDETNTLTWRQTRDFTTRCCQTALPWKPEGAELFVETAEV